MHSVLKYCFGLPEVAFETGTTLITEGKGRGPLFVLVSGSVSVHRGDMEVARIDAPGAIFGEMSALLDVPHTATVRAETDVRVHTFEHANQFLESRPQIALQVAGLLARRLHDATTYLVEARRRADAAGIGEVAREVDAIVHGRKDIIKPDED